VDISKQISDAQGPNQEDCVVIVMRKEVSDAPWSFLQGGTKANGTPDGTSESVTVDNGVANIELRAFSWFHIVIVKAKAAVGAAY
jgi:hypothetical protein